MSSVTKTFKCVFPLWTMNVWPTHSGTIVQARAQVVTGSFTPDWFCRSTLPYNLASTNGPFFRDRPIGMLAAAYMPIYSRPILGRFRERRPGWPVYVLFRNQFLHTISPATAATHNRFVRCFAGLAGHATLRTLACGTHRMAAAFGASFTAAVRMVNRIHGCATNVRLAAEPASSSRFAVNYPHVVRITGGSDGRAAG